MLEVADIVRAAGPEVCAQLAVLPSQKRALQAIQLCRTTALGGQVYGCEQCGALHYSYHSCGNRHCPKCHGQQTQRWLEQQRTRLLPCPYYLLTFTLPAQLRTPARSHQKLVYGLLLNAAAASVQKLCADPQWLGAQVSLMGVLHTWTRAMLYHPHAHFLVSAGGLSFDGQRWMPPKNPQVPASGPSFIQGVSSQGARRPQSRWAPAPGSLQNLDSKMGRARSARRQWPEGARLPGPLCLPHRHYPLASGEPTSWPGNLSLSRQPNPTTQTGPAPGGGVCQTFPPTRLA